jgi:hypothetical protein
MSCRALGSDKDVWELLLAANRRLYTGIVALAAKIGWENIPRKLEKRLINFECMSVLVVDNALLEDINWEGLESLLALLSVSLREPWNASEWFKDSEEQEEISDAESDGEYESEASEEEENAEDSKEEDARDCKTVETPIKELSENNNRPPLTREESSLWSFAARIATALSLS